MRSLITLITFLVVAPLAHGMDLFVFPNDGQSQDQQDMDTFQCQRASTDRTGFDPMATPTASTAPPQQQGGVVGGAARGALLGGAIGAATGNTRQGLRAGAAGGGVLGGMRRADSNRQQEDWARREAANYQRNRDNWNRAFIACMEARGYTVR
jgi:outer membrane lipoprotein SlyB